MAGYATGSGWIDSPAGAYATNPDLTGKATFGFVSQYKKGANVPTGNTQFQFHTAGLDFKSTSYEWLVVAGAKAQFKGEGTINGQGSFGFMLIWNKATGSVVYDNQMGTDESGDASTALGGGSIVIHK